MAERYLVQVKKKGSQYHTTDQLRNFEYYHSKTSDLSPTSHETRFHILRSVYVTHQMMYGHTLDGDDLNLTLYGFEIVDDLLVPQTGRNPIPEDFTVKCTCTKCGSERCPCRSKQRSCCSFCKCRSNFGVSACKNPYE